MQRNPHSYQIATGYRTFYSLSLIYQPITKKRLFYIGKKYYYLLLFFLVACGLMLSVLHGQPKQGYLQYKELDMENVGVHPLV